MHLKRYENILNKYIKHICGINRNGQTHSVMNTLYVYANWLITWKVTVEVAIAIISFIPKWVPLSIFCNCSVEQTCFCRFLADKILSTHIRTNHVAHFPGCYSSQSDFYYDLVIIWQIKHNIPLVTFCTENMFYKSNFLNKVLIYTSDKNWWEMAVKFTSIGLFVLLL